MTVAPAPQSGAFSRLARAIGGAVSLVVLTAACLAARSSGRVIDLYPAVSETSCDEEFVRVANSLQAGDTLVLHGGIYSQPCARRLRRIHGTEDRPIVIQAASGETPILTRPKDGDGRYAANNLEIEDSSHLTIRGVSLKGGSTGIRFLGSNRAITLEDNEVHETDNNAIAMNSGDTDSFVIRRNHLHHTGLLPLALGTTEGEGLYVGCHDGTCVGSHHVIENNYIHHLRGTSEGGNDGIEVKVGSYGIVVRDNVIHDTTIGTRFPCIFVYGGGPQPNIVEGNAVWRCGEAIQVVADAIVRNNIILNSDVGIISAPHRQVPRMRGVAIVNNTLYGHRECAVLRWQRARDMLLANNALYCPAGHAVNAQGLDDGEVVVRANLIEGVASGATVDGVRFVTGGQAREAFSDPAARDLWPRPTAPLIGAGVGELGPARDFNGSPRTRPFDVGAYQSEGRPANPGWRIAPGIKGP